MQQSHGMGYAEYNRNLENRLMVEKQRDKDYRKSLEIVSNFAGNSVHK